MTEKQNQYLSGGKVKVDAVRIAMASNPEDPGGVGIFTFRAEKIPLCHYFFTLIKYGEP